MVQLDTAVTPLPAAERAGQTTPSVSRRRTNAGCISSIAAAWLTEKSGAASSGTATDRWTRLVLDGAAPLSRLTTRRRRPALATRRCELASIDVVWLPPTEISTRRGFACSFTGTRSRNTPSV